MIEESTKHFTLLAVPEKAIGNSNFQINRSLTRLSVLLLLLLAFALRIYDLHLYPPGASPDEAGDVIDILNIAQSGRFPIYEDYAIPEPLHRILFAGLSLGVGNNVWSIRFLGACAGILSVALIAWVARACLRYGLGNWGENDPEQAPMQLAEFAIVVIATAMLTLSLSHIVISRSIYRAILQPIFTLLFMGWLLRGLAKRQWHSLIGSGVALALTLYSYTAGLVVPGVLGLLGLQLLLTQFRLLRRWLPALFLIGIVFLLAVAPMLNALLTNPQFVIGRANELNNGQGALLGWNELQRLLNQFIAAGDGNPQYNIASAPLVSQIWLPFFVLGIVTLLVRIHQPAAVLLLGLLALATIPVLLAGEIPHGLRIMGVFAVLPIMIGVGFAQFAIFLSWLLQRWQSAKVAMLLTFLLALALVGAQGFQTVTTYFSFWSKTGDSYTTVIFGHPLPVSEWFFRPDRRDLARWLSVQQAPLLIPREELEQQTTHAWLAADFPTIIAATEPISLPKGTTLVVPWSLEQNDLRRATRHYALLYHHTITLLPPWDEQTHAELLADIDDTQALTRTGAIDLLARIRMVHPEQKFTFEPADPIATKTLPVAEFQTGMAIRSVRGPLLITDTPQSMSYTLEWESAQRPAHFYSSFVQIQTQTGERIAGDDVYMGRWLLAPPFWQAKQMMPDIHQLALSDKLAPGAYKLVAGLYLAAGNWLPTVDETGIIQGDSAQLAWIKVPLPVAAPLPESAVPLTATIANAITLQQVALTQSNAGVDRVIDLQLAWRALVPRPNFDATIFVHLVDAAGNLIAQQDARPHAGAYPTFIWDKGEIVITQHQINLPGTDSPTSPDSFHLLVGMYTFPDLARLPVIQDGSRAEDDRIDLGELAGNDEEIEDR